MGRFAALAFLLLALPIPRARADIGPIPSQCIAWVRTEPYVVNAVETKVLCVVVKAAQAVDKMELVFTDGTVLPMWQIGTSYFVALLGPAQFLAGYVPGKSLYRNSPAQIWVTKGGGVVEQQILTICVWDPTMPLAPVKKLSRTAQLTPHVLQLRLPTRDVATLSEKQVAKAAYTYLGDVYDFLAIVTLPERLDFTYYLSAKNDVQGIGLPLVDQTAQFGSGGTLQGCIRFSRPGVFDLGSRLLCHELGHRWMNFLKKVPALATGVSHWPKSSFAYGMLGAAGSPGWPWGLAYGAAQGSLVFTALPKPTTYNTLELYLMGLLPLSQVQSGWVLADQDEQPAQGKPLEGGLLWVTPQQILAAYGPRKPHWSKAQKTFRIATVVVTGDRLLAPWELAYFDYFAARGEAKTPLPGLWGPEYPFYVATGKRGILITKL